MRPPDKEGIAGKARNVNTVENLLKKPDFQASIAAYLVYAPHAHPFWSYYFICVVHLRDIPGVKPAGKQFDGAKYEFFIVSIDPDSTPDPDLIQFQLLSPPDLCFQIKRHDKSDDFAGKLCEQMIYLILRRKNVAR